MLLPDDRNGERHSFFIQHHSGDRYFIRCQRDTFHLLGMLVDRNQRNGQCFHFIFHFFRIHVCHQPRDLVDQRSSALYDNRILTELHNIRFTVVTVLIDDLCLYRFLDRYQVIDCHRDLLRAHALDRHIVRSDDTQAHHVFSLLETLKIGNHLEILGFHLVQRGPLPRKRDVDRIALCFQHYQIVLRQCLHICKRDRNIAKGIG